DADELEAGALRLLYQRQRVALDRELVLQGAARLHGKRALGNRGAQGELIAADGVAAGIHVQHVEHGDLVVVGGDIVRGIGWERLGAVQPDGAVVLFREEVQPGLRTGKRRAVRIGDLRNLPGP